MLNPTQTEIERIAGEAGWDSFTLLLLISRWAQMNDLAGRLIEHLTGVAAAWDDPDDE
jgi:hypothetical protein